jgi:restriction system protein
VSDKDVITYAINRTGSRISLRRGHIQAKRWQNPVGRPEIQKFVGALVGKRAKKGVFITTSTFTKEAIAYAESIENKVVLIDGYQLVKYMIQHMIIRQM